MKKLLILVIGALAVCVAVVTVMETRSVSAGLSVDTFKCYKARHAKRANRFQPQRIFVTDQFRHNVEVSVLKVATHCSSADQELYYDGSAAGFPLGIDCYTVRDAPRQERFRSQNIDVRDKLTNWGEQTLTVSKVQSLCTLSVKNLKFKGTLEGDAFVCYQAKTAKGEPRFQQRDMTVWDNYSQKEVRVIRPVAYCSQAEKKVDAEIDDFNSQETSLGSLPESPACYQAGSTIECEDHFSTVYATLEPNDPPISCKTPGYSNSVWYHWNASGDFSVIIDTYGSSYDTVVAVFTGDKGDLDEVTCNDDVDMCAIRGSEAAGCPCPTGAATAGCCAIEMGSPAGHGDCPVDTSSHVQFDAADENVYHILVASSEGHGGKLKFHLRTKEDGPDNCPGGSLTNALTQLTYVGQSDLRHYSTMNASPNAASCPADAPASCSKTPEHTVWFNYRTPSNQTQDIRFDASDSSYDTLVAVYRDSTLIDCGNGSAVASPLLPNTTYHVMVGDVDPDREGGKLKLRHTLEGYISAGSQAGVAEQGTPDSITCYQVRQPRHSNQTVEIWDQFSIRQFDGPWTLIVGAVDSVCVPSNKETCTGYNFLNGVGEAAQLCEG